VGLGPAPEPGKFQERGEGFWTPLNDGETGPVTEEVPRSTFVSKTAKDILMSFDSVFSLLPGVVMVVDSSPKRRWRGRRAAVNSKIFAGIV
jgi:hypothetical protein